MIVNDKEALNRLDSPMNLLNQLKRVTKKNERSSAMSLFVPSKKQEEKFIEEVTVTFNPFSTKAESQTSLLPQSTSSSSQSERLEDVLDNPDSQIKLGLAHDKALDLLHRSVEMLSLKLDDVSASKLPAVISAASKTVESIRRERLEQANTGKDREVHYHFYTPEQKKVTDYEVVDVQ